MRYRGFANATILRHELAANERIIIRSIGDLRSALGKMAAGHSAQLVFLPSGRCLEIRDAQAHLE